jgi:ribonuclease E
MADIIIPQGGATNPVIPAAQDLQINLADAPKVEEITTPENKGPELNLDLDLNLSDAPKDDDRLKTEDQKNNQVIETPAVEIAPVESTVEMPVAAEPTLLETTPEAVAEITQLETPMEQTIETPVIEQAPVENTVEEIINPEPIVETVVETPVAEEVIPVAEEISTPSTTIEAIPSSSEVIS